MRYTYAMWFVIPMFLLLAALAGYAVFKTVQQIKAGNGLRWLVVIITIASVIAFVRILFTGMPTKGTAEPWFAPAIIACLVAPAIVWLLYYKYR